MLLMLFVFSFQMMFVSFNSNMVNAVCQFYHLSSFSFKRHNQNVYLYSTFNNAAVIQWRSVIYRKRKPEYPEVY